MAHRQLQSPLPASAPRQPGGHFACTAKQAQVQHGCSYPPPHVPCATCSAGKSPKKAAAAPAAAAADGSTEDASPAAAAEAEAVAAPPKTAAKPKTKRKTASDEPPGQHCQATSSVLQGTVAPSFLHCHRARPRQRYMCTQCVHIAPCPACQHGHNRGRQQHQADMGWASAAESRDKVPATLNHKLRCCCLPVLHA